MEYKKWFVECSVGYCGMDGHYLIELPADATEDEVGMEAYYKAVEHAEMYGYYPRDEYNEEDTLGEDGEPQDCYVEGIEGCAEPYDPEKHDSRLY